MTWLHIWSKLSHVPHVVDFLLSASLPLPVPPCGLQLPTGLWEVNSVEKLLLPPQCSVQVHKNHGKNNGFLVMLTIRDAIWFALAAIWGKVCIFTTTHVLILCSKSPKVKSTKWQSTANYPMASFVALAPDKSCLSGTLDGLKWHKELMMVLRTKARSNMYQKRDFC